MPTAKCRAANDGDDAPSFCHLPAMAFSGALSMPQALLVVVGVGVSL